MLLKLLSITNSIEPSKVKIAIHPEVGTPLYIYLIQLMGKMILYNRYKDLHGFLASSQLHYIGEFQETKPHGDGIICISNYATYTTKFKQGIPDDHGILKTNKGEYTFIFENGILNKNVKMEIKEGIYLGEIKGGQFHGKGTLTFHTGGSCEGWFNNGKLYGEIEQKNQRGDIIYKGTVENRRYHGHGVLYFSREHFYKGTFYKGLRQGYGVEILFNQYRYEGLFENNRYHREGMLSLENGYYYKGPFIKGLPHGTGILSRHQNEYICTFTNGVTEKHSESDRIYTIKFTYEGKYLRFSEIAK